MNKLPNEIIRQIRKFDSHPVADLFKETVKTVNEEYYDTDYFCHADTKSFAEYFFWDRGLTKQYEREFDDWRYAMAEMDDEGYDY